MTITADRNNMYYLGSDEDEEVWAWDKYDGVWERLESCPPDCCGEAWRIDEMTEPEFQEYLDSFEEKEIDFL